MAPGPRILIVAAHRFYRTNHCVCSITRRNGTRETLITNIFRLKRMIFITPPYSVNTTMPRVCEKMRLLFLCANKQTNKRTNSRILCATISTTRSHLLSFTVLVRTHHIDFHTPTHLFAFESSMIGFPSVRKQCHCRRVETLLTSQFSKGKREEITKIWKSKKSLPGVREAHVCHRNIFFVFFSVWSMSIDRGWRIESINIIIQRYCWVKWTLFNKHHFHIVLPSLKVKEHIKTSNNTIEL